LRLLIYMCPENEMAKSIKTPICKSVWVRSSRIG